MAHNMKIKKQVNRSSEKGQNNYSKIEYPTVALTKRYNIDKVKIYGERFVFDCITGSFHRISETAAFIIRELQRETKLLDIIELFSKHYNISTKKAVADVEILISELIALNILGAKL